MLYLSLYIPILPIDMLTCWPNNLLERTNTLYNGFPCTIYMKCQGSFKSMGLELNMDVHTTAAANQYNIDLEKKKKIKIKTSQITISIVANSQHHIILFS